jgi:hypothetical protein
MRRRRKWAAVVGPALFSATCATVTAPVDLKLEERTTLHVSEVGVLPVIRNAECGSACHMATGSYSVNRAPSNLELVKRFRQRRRDLDVYRALSPGNATFVLSPSGIPARHCISCATIHYFVTVVP